MTRREFIAFLGGAAAVWPIVARAQQSGKEYRIGILTGQLRSEDQDTSAFLDEMHRNGFDEGRNLRVDYRGILNPDHLTAAAAELVATTPDVLVSFGSPATVALKKTGTTVPIVFGQVADPVAIGVVQSFPRPGGNITGVSNLMADIRGEEASAASRSDSAGSEDRGVHPAGKPVRENLARAIHGSSSRT